MNISSLIGLLGGLVVCYYSIGSSKMDMRFFLDFHGALIVLGGTLAAASISFPISKVLSLTKVFILRVLGKKQVNLKHTIQQIMSLDQVIKEKGTFALHEEIKKIKHPFLKESAELVAQGVLTTHEIRHTLETRIKTTESRLFYEANMFRVIGKYPPAFGLLATTLGMIAVLQKIGQPDSHKLIGPAMSIGLIGTLYGIALANLVFLPIAENLTERTKHEMEQRRLILEGVILLKEQVSPTALREELNSFLLPNERIKRVYTNKTKTQTVDQAA